LIFQGAFRGGVVEMTPRLFLLFLLCFFYPSVVFANQYCQEKKRSLHTRVALKAEIAAPYILQDSTLAQINAETKESRETWLKEHHMEEVWASNETHTLGYAMGGMASAYKTELFAVPYDDYGIYYCPFFKDVEINIIYRTLIRVPKEFPKGTCLYDVILRHEMRHHTANKESFDRYMTQLKGDLPQMVRYYEQVPVKRATVQQKFGNMKISVEEAIKLYIQDYVLVAAKKINDEIDSPESYAAEAKKMEACETKK